jgi:hypothetical protein
MEQERSKKKAQILGMMHGYPTAKSQISEGTVNAYLLAVDDCSLEAVTRSCGQFLSGKVDGHDNAFMPSAAQLASNARQWDSALASIAATRGMQKMVIYKVGEKPPPPLKPLGPIKMEIEGIMRDTSDWTYDEKEEAMTTGKMPKSRATSTIGEAATLKIQRMRDA